MNVPQKLTATAAALALGVTPAVALAHGPGTHGKSQTAPGHTKTTQSQGKNSKAKEYGKLCQQQGATKKHVKGMKGTPFSVCVKDLAQAAKKPKTNPHTLCSNEPRTHIKGEKGTPYSQCVKAAAKLEKQHNKPAGTTSTTTGTTTSGS